jgi:hypothetical protein
MSLFRNSIVASSLLVLALSCNSTPIDDSRGAGGKSGSGSTGDSGSGDSVTAAGESAGGFSSGGSSAGGDPSMAGENAGGDPGINLDGACLGPEESPTDGKGCGCQTDCDFGQVCVTEKVGFPGGFCAQGCTDVADCQSGFDCVELTPGDPDTRLCWPQCDTTKDCRQGYVCGPFLAVLPAGQAAHLPSGNFCQSFCQSDADCPITKMCNHFDGGCGHRQPEQSDIGEACASANDCTQICFTDTDGGYCSAMCSLVNPGCPEGSACEATLVDAGDFGSCLQECTDASDCRTGYTCAKGDSGKKVCR